MMVEPLDSCSRKMNINHLLSPNTKINSRWIIELHIKIKTIKLLEESIGKYFMTSIFSEFLDKTQKALNIKEKEFKILLHIN